MSLYRLLHGVDPLAAVFRAMLGLDQPDGKWPTGRFRDIHLSGDGTRITVVTRNGGGNRDHWIFGYTSPAGESCRCPGCIIQHLLPKHPNYVRDWDDDFDATYAYVEFSVPVELAEVCRKMASGQEPKRIRELFDDEIKRMQGMSREELLADPKWGAVAEALEGVITRTETDRPRVAEI